jgi:hypothetical protein
VNSKGFKVLKGCGVLQGDGINTQIMKVGAFAPSTLPCYFEENISQQNG